MKEITKEDLYVLIKHGIVRNTRKGIVDTEGDPVGFYRTRNKRYIEDRFADLAKKIIEGVHDGL